MDGADVYHCVRVSIGDDGVMDGPVRTVNTADCDAVPMAGLARVGYGGPRHLGYDDRAQGTVASPPHSLSSLLIWKGTAIPSTSNSTVKLLLHGHGRRPSVGPRD